MRVRLDRVEGVDLNLFRFDYDLTLMVFFLDADERIYARYGQRDASSADAKQSLAGLRYTMESVLRMHEQAQPRFVPRVNSETIQTHDLVSNRRGCFHCHHVKEAMMTELRRDGFWTRQSAWRYPPPENLGFSLEVDRGNRVEQVAADSAAKKAGLRKGDLLVEVGGLPVHSIADVQHALDLAPLSGKLPLSWKRDGTQQTASLVLSPEWKRSDVSWRPSMRHVIARLPVYGEDLSTEEKKALQLPPNALAFRQQKNMHSQMQKAGLLPGDIILGVNKRPFEGDVLKFLDWIRSEYLEGDPISLDLIRDGKRMSLPITLRN